MQVCNRKLKNAHNVQTTLPDVRSKIVLLPNTAEPLTFVSYRDRTETERM